MAKVRFSHCKGHIFNEGGHCSESTIRCRVAAAVIRGHIHHLSKPIFPWPTVGIFEKPPQKHLTVTYRVKHEGLAYSKHLVTPRGRGEEGYSGVLSPPVKWPGLITAHYSRARCHSRPAGGHWPRRCRFPRWRNKDAVYYWLCHLAACPWKPMRAALFCHPQPSIRHNLKMKVEYELFRMEISFFGVMYWEWGKKSLQGV